MNVIIDRFEGDFAVVELENGSYVNISKKIIPAEADEGAVLSITVNWEETEKLRTDILRLMKGNYKEESSNSQRPNSLNDLFKNSNVGIQPCKEWDTGAPVGKESW